MRSMRFSYQLIVNRGSGCALRARNLVNNEARADHCVHRYPLIGVPRQHNSAPEKILLL